ncbi:MAG: VanZ family protein [Solobacterium sp.]|nr:VanZ family protein [Solobacterium sp.]
MSTLSPILANLTSFFHLEVFEFNWIPFLDWKYQYGNYIEESIANIFLFIPFSLSYGICFRKRPYLAIPIGFFFSMFIEFTQALLLLNRVGDISDILTNTFGCILGVGLYYLIKERIYNMNLNDKAKEKQLD